MRARPVPLETVSLDVPAAAVPLFEAALAPHCRSLGLFGEETDASWRLEAVRAADADPGPLLAALALAEALSGLRPALTRRPIAADGWAARSAASFPAQAIGRRFLVRGTHLREPAPAGRIVLTLDAGAAFGSGEHPTTRLCLRALDGLAARRPRRILDLGTGSGILAMAAARLTGRVVRAVDIDPWSVRVAAENARRNGLGPRIRVRRADGWRSPGVRGAGPYDLVLANILARPLCAMARDLAAGLAPGGYAVVSGLLAGQARMVLAAHRRAGLVLRARLTEGAWAALVLTRRLVPSHAAARQPGADIPVFLSKTGYIRPRD